MADRRNGDSVLAAAIAAGRPIVQAAKDAGVSPRTAHRRLQEPEFQQQVSHLRDNAVGAALDCLCAGMTEAANRLVELARSADPGVALRACRHVLELGLRLRESESLERRLDAVEQALADREGNHAR